MVLDWVKLMWDSRGRNPSFPKPKSISTWHLATQEGTQEQACMFSEIGGEVCWRLLQKEHLRLLEKES